MSETQKLATILIADVVGYSRLAGGDEGRILARLRTPRRPENRLRRGRIVKRPCAGIIIASQTLPPRDRSPERVAGDPCRLYFIISMALSACILQPASSFLSIISFAICSSFIAASFLALSVTFIIIASFDFIAEAQSANTGDALPSATANASPNLLSICFSIS